MQKEIVLLAKSLKDHGYCVAGIDLQTKQWVRLVSDIDGEAISKDALDSRGIKELDTIRVDVIKPVPSGCHTEDWLLNSDATILKTGSYSLDQVTKLRSPDHHETLYGNTKSELDANEIKQQNHSLELIEAKNIVFDTSLKGDGRYHHHVNFQYNYNRYDCSLTDPKVRNEKIDGYPIPQAYLVVSLPKEPYGESHTYKKFVAKVFVRL